MVFKPNSQRERLIVALDFPSFEDALEMTKSLRGHVGLFKIGKELFTREGPRAVEEIVSLGEQVFLDLKFHDIPDTVAGPWNRRSRSGPR